MARALLIITLAMCLSIPGIEAQDHGGRKKPPGKESEGKNGKDPKETRSVTRHSIEIGGKAVEYTAVAGTINLKKNEKKTRAQVFHIAYAVTGSDGNRPVTFCFNGGPGSSSVWLHMGAWGPKKIKLDDFGRAGTPPYALEDNLHSLLDVTDLVFIDPVSTGFSRAADGEKPGQFHGYHEDIESIGEFIRVWTSRNKRWNSPKYLAGESYGTLRAGGLAGHLQSRYGMNLNGIILVSAVLDFSSISFTEGNDKPFPLFLPTYTATAYHHGKLEEELMLKELPELLKEVETFALNEYARGLLLGDRIGDKEREFLLEQLARYTALPKDEIDRLDMRISQRDFSRALLKDEKLIVGRFDGRYTGPLTNRGKSTGDPSYHAILGPFATTMNDYLRRDLKVKNEAPYEILTGKVHPWNYSSFKNKFVRSSSTLRDAMIANPHLKVFLASGRLDLATPYFAADHVMAHLGLPKKLRSNIITEYYDSGHMMYLRKADIVKLKKDLAGFYKK